jgi:hypothetical protein
MKKKPQAVRIPIRQAIKPGDNSQDKVRPVEVMATTAVVLLALYCAAKRGWIDQLIVWWAQ